MTDLVDYYDDVDDNRRWRRFVYRDGDVVISTRSKHGTTWIQMICALLLHGTTALPAPLGELSPWLDHCVEPLDRVLARLAAQPFRRIVKTHTPLDGIPIDPRARYIVVARHPLDAAVSLYHHSLNLDRFRIAALAGLERPVTRVVDMPPLDVWLRGWIANRAQPREMLESPAGVCWHIGDAWARRHEPNVLLVHYADLRADLATQMRRVAAFLGLAVDMEAFPALVDAATFARMRERAEDLAPDRAGVIIDRSRFFRRGESGGAREILGPDDFAQYESRARELAPSDLFEWLHRE